MSTYLNDLVSNSKVKSSLINHSDCDYKKSGQGPFIETLKGDFIYDLRLNSQKPFLGHNHPLFVQFSHGMLSSKVDINSTAVSRDDIANYKSAYTNQSLELIDELFNVSQKKISLTIDEDYFLANIGEMQSLSKKIKEISKRNQILIIERDLVGINDCELFYFDELKNIDNIELIIDSHLFTSNLYHGSFKFSPHEEQSLFSAIFEYLTMVVSSRINGKNKIDSIIIDEELIDRLDLKVIGRYIFSKSPISFTEARKVGLAVSNETFLNLPIACTNNELRDILKKLKQII